MNRNLLDYFILSVLVFAFVLMVFLLNISEISLSYLLIMLSGLFFICASLLCYYIFRKNRFLYYCAVVGFLYIYVLSLTYRFPDTLTMNYDIDTILATGEFPDYYSNNYPVSFIFFMILKLIIPDNFLNVIDLIWPALFIGTFLLFLRYLSVKPVFIVLLIFALLNEYTIVPNSYSFLIFIIAFALIIKYLEGANHLSFIIMMLICFLSLILSHPITFLILIPVLFFFYISHLMKIDKKEKKGVLNILLIYGILSILVIGSKILYFKSFRTLYFSLGYLFNGAPSAASGYYVSDPTLSYQIGNMLIISKLAVSLFIIFFIILINKKRNLSNIPEYLTIAILGIGFLALLFSQGTNTEQILSRLINPILFLLIYSISKKQMYSLNELKKAFSNIKINKIRVFNNRRLIVTFSIFIIFIIISTLFVNYQKSDYLEYNYSDMCGFKVLKNETFDEIESYSLNTEKYLDNSGRSDADLDTKECSVVYNSGSFLGFTQINYTTDDEPINYE